LKAKYFREKTLIKPLKGSYVLSQVRVQQKMSGRN